MKNAVNPHALIFIKTTDGSYTFHDSDLNENYHSINGARTESQYVYIDHGLSTLKKEHIDVLEMGFGTGLNAILTWQFAHLHNKSVYYQTIENRPIAADNLPVPDFIAADKEWAKKWILLHLADWNQGIHFDHLFKILKLQTDLTSFQTTNYFDIVFFDAFAPSVQPELWTAAIFKRIYRMLKPGGILVTYSSAGIVKRSLVESGFMVNRIQGPPGKKHMLRAIKKQVEDL
jgi:tRNA U34 5-methylaminomethyl-2-thiouridine-forming methyltransferase MnmC